MSKNNSSWKEFFKSKYFLQNLGMVVGMVILFFVVVMFSIKRWTYHGEAIEMPDLLGQYVETTGDLIDKHKFKLILADSVFIVGKPGGLIINQNPTPGSKVKRKRSVYVTITKSKADEIAASRLPTMYGKSYERKSRELKNGYEIFTKIVDYKYDSGPENYILAVIYKGDTIVSNRVREMDVMIEKGSTLECVVSKASGGEIDRPNMVCKSYQEALFLARTLQIHLVEDPSSEATDKYEAYIHQQIPEFYPGSRMLMGDTITVYLRENKPVYCDEGEEEQGDEE